MGKVHSFILPGIFFVQSLFFTAPAKAALDLKRSFESALKHNQIDNINQARIEQNEQLKKQAAGDYLPTISARGTYQKQDGVGSQTSTGLNLTHSLYRGGRDGIEEKSASLGLEMAQNQKRVGDIDLYTSVIQAYYNYLLNWNDQKNLDLLKKQSQDRADEIGKRVGIGRSRKGERLQAEAQLASVLAQHANGLGLLKESEEKFYILTGLDRSETFGEEVQALKAPLAKSKEEYLAEALKRDDVKNKQLAVEQAGLQVDIAKGGHLPTLDLTSNYYLSRTGGTQSSRNTDWDVGLTLSFPLFEGGRTTAKVQENVARKQEAIYALSDYQKAIELDVTAKYETFRRYSDQITAYDQAMEKGRSSYNETLRDYRLGLVSNLDVLTSLNLYLDSKRNAEKTKIQALMNQKILEVSAGILP